MSLLGGIVGGVGNALHLPEWGISEYFNGEPPRPDYSAPGTTYSQADQNYQNFVKPSSAPIAPGVGMPSVGVYGGGGAADPGEASFWQGNIDSLNRLLQSAGMQLEQGRAGIGDAFGRAVGRTNQDRDQALSSYGTQRTDTEQGKLSALGRVDAGARNTYNGLMRLLGMSGAGVSSAAREGAPNAVSRQASQQRGQVFDTFGRNLRDIDTAETETKSDFERVLEDLGLQRREQEEDLERGVLGTQNDITGQLATAAAQKTLAEGGNAASANAARAPFQGQINQRMSALDQLFAKYRNPVMNTAPVTAAAPQLADYTVDPTRLASQRANPELDSSLLPYLSSLRKRQPSLI